MIKIAVFSSVNLLVVNPNKAEDPCLAGSFKGKIKRMLARVVPLCTNWNIYIVSITKKVKRPLTLTFNYVKKHIYICICLLHIYICF